MYSQHCGRYTYRRGDDQRTVQGNTKSSVRPGDETMHSERIWSKEKTIVGLHAVAGGALVDSQGFACIGARDFEEGPRIIW